MFLRLFAASFFFCIGIAGAADPALEGRTAMAETCGKLFGAKQTAERLRQGGFSEKGALEETLNRPEWQNAPMSEVIWAVRIVDETYAYPGVQSSQVLRECMARAQGVAAPNPVQLPEDL